MNAEFKGPPLPMSASSAQGCTHPPSISQFLFFNSIWIFITLRAGVFFYRKLNQLLELACRKRE